MPNKLKCQHKICKLGYIRASEDAEKRMAKGEKQIKCPVCNLWIWESRWYKGENP